jgi:hypothetical protein
METSSDAGDDTATRFTDPATRIGKASIAEQYSSHLQQGGLPLKSQNGPLMS